MVFQKVMLMLFLPRAKSAREATANAKVISHGLLKGNTAVVADQKETWYMEILSGQQYVAVKALEDKYAVFANT